MSLQNIPAELRQRPQWVFAHDDKIPRNPRTGDKADTTDPATWGTFEEACRAGAKHVGYVLAKDDPFSAIDLDAPLTPEQAERHSFILEAAESYAEISQSGHGVHIFVRGKIPHGVRRDKVEVYSDGRYMICTGNVLNALPIAERQDMLNVLFKEMSTTGRAQLVEQDEVMSDEQLWEMGAGAVNGDKFQKLWQGDWQGDYPSQSEADFALMAMLCYYSKSNEQCRRLFRMAELGKRDKALRDRYLNYMIEKCRAHEPPPVDLEAIRNLTLPDEDSNVTSSTTVAVPEQINGRAYAVGKIPPPPPRKAGQQSVSLAVVEPATSQSLSTGNSIQFPPGLVGDVADYVYSSAIRPVKEIALATSLALTAGIAGRSYNVSGTGLNQYLILVAKTGCGKEGIASSIDALVAALRPSIPMADRFIGPAAFASGQGLVRTLDERPCFLSVLGEFGTTMQILCDPRANESTRVLKKVILDLYNKSGFNKVLRGSVYSDSDKNTKLVQAPNVTILGETTPEELYNHLEASHVTSGLLPRFSIIEYKGDRPDRNPHAFHAPSDPLLNQLGELVTIALTTQQNRTCCPIQIDQYAQEVLDELDSYADSQIRNSNEIERELWNRTHLKALKLASLLAVGCNAQNPIVDKGMAEWARDFVCHDVLNIAGRFEAGDIGDGQAKQEVDVKNAIRDYRKMLEANRRTYKVPESLVAESNVIPFHYLRRRLRQVSSFKNDRRGFAAAIEDILGQMVKAEALVQIDRRTATESFGVSQPLYAVGPTF